jgi:hypothetical protein
MLRATILKVALLLFGTCLMAQTSFEPFPDLLEKELIRANGENNVLKELQVASPVLAGEFYTVSDFSATSKIKYVYLGRVKTCRAGGCSINRNQGNDKESEFFDYFILFDSTCKVQQVRIYNYQATHGQEITSKNWLRQFKNYTGEKELMAGKNIDAISGATISVDAIISDIEFITGALLSICRKS